MKEWRERKNWPTPLHPEFGPFTSDGLVDVARGENLPGFITKASLVSWWNEIVTGAGPALGSSIEWGPPKPVQDGWLSMDDPRLPLDGTPVQCLQEFYKHPHDPKLIGYGAVVVGLYADDNGDYESAAVIHYNGQTLVAGYRASFLGWKPLYPTPPQKGE